jgi:acyl carrier protein
MSALTDSEVALRPLQPTDYDWLYSAFANANLGRRWVAHGTTPSHEEFRRLLWQGVLAQYVVELKKSAVPIGLVTAYNASFRNGVAYLSAFALPQGMYTGGVLRGLAVLISYLFDQWPIRKLYIEATETSVHQFQSALGRILAEEGRLREFELEHGAYVDTIIGSIGAAEWARYATGASTVSDVVRRISQHGANSAAQSDEGVLQLEEFADVVSGLLGHQVKELDDPLTSVGADSLHLIELLSIIESRTGTWVDLRDVGRGITLRGLYQLYTTQASKPIEHS